MKQIKSLLLLTLLAWHMSYLQAEPSNQAEWDQAQAPDFIVQQQSDTDQQKNIVSTLYEKDYDTWQGITNLKKITTYDDGNITTELKTSVPTMLSWKNLAYGVGAAGALGLGAAGAYYALSPSQNSAEPVVPVAEPNPTIMPTPGVNQAVAPILPVAAPAPTFVAQPMQNPNIAVQLAPVIPAAMQPTDNNQQAPAASDQPEQAESSWWNTAAGLAATGAAAAGMYFMGQPEREREDKNLKNDAATKIQANERGHQARKKFSRYPMDRDIPEASINISSQSLVPYAGTNLALSSNDVISQPSAADFDILNLQPGAQITVNDVNRAFRRAAPTYHADKDGDQHQWQQLQDARNALIAWIEQNNQPSNNGQPLQITWPDAAEQNTADQNTTGQGKFFIPHQNNALPPAITNIPGKSNQFKQITEQEEAAEIARNKKKMADVVAQLEKQTPQSKLKLIHEQQQREQDPDDSWNLDAQTDQALANHVDQNERQLQLIQGEIQQALQAQKQNKAKQQNAAATKIQARIRANKARQELPSTPEEDIQGFLQQEEDRKQELKIAQENDNLSALSEDDFDTIFDETSEDFNTQSSISEDDFENVPSQNHDSDNVLDMTSIYPSSNDTFEGKALNARLTPQKRQKSEFEINVTSTDSAAPSNKLNQFSRQQLTQIINYEADEIKQAQKQNKNRSNTTNSKTSSSLRTPTPPKDEKRSTESPIQKKRTVNKISQESLNNLEQMLQKKQEKRAISADTNSPTTTSQKQKWQLPQPRSRQDQRTEEEIAQEDAILKGAF